jgi:hypothetical protein
MKSTIDMARESHLDVYGLGKDHAKFVDTLKAFEALVRKDELEACAKVCEEVLEQYRGTDMGKHAELVGDACANAIRARSKDEK